MSWFLTIFFLIGLTIPSVASHEEKIHPAVIVGRVYCDTCFSKSSHFISGASVGVECKGSSSTPKFQAEVKTDNQGLFKVYLPISVSKHVKRLERCSVRLISSSEPYCAVAAAASSSSLHLKSRKKGTHIYSAGYFTFKPLKQPNVCHQKPSLIQDLNNEVSFTDSDKFLYSPNDELVFPPPAQKPVYQGVPSFPKFHYLLPPLPQLPGLPGLSGLPKFPFIPGKDTDSKPQTKSHTTERHLTEEEKVHPDFLFPPIIPPNPVLPGPAPLIPNPFQPPPAPVIPNLPPLPNFPPLPGLTPPPSPPPPSLPTIPTLPVPPSLPIPPVPLIPGVPPVPLIPGVPPASSSP